MERQLKLVFKRDYRNNLTFIYITDKKINLEKLGLVNYLNLNDEEWKQCRLEDEEWIENDGIILEKVDEQEYSETLKEYEDEGFTKEDLLEDIGWRDINGVIYTEISDKDKKRYNNFELGWYDLGGNLISDELDILEKEEGELDFGDYVYYWVTPKNLTFEEFEAYLKNPVWSEIMEILDELKIDNDVYHFLLKKEDYYYFQDLVKKISREIYDGCNLNEILEKILEIIGEEEEE